MSLNRERSAGRPINKARLYCWTFETQLNSTAVNSELLLYAYAVRPVSLDAQSALSHSLGSDSLIYALYHPSTIVIFLHTIAAITLHCAHSMHVNPLDRPDRSTVLCSLTGITVVIAPNLVCMYVFEERKTFKPREQAMERSINLTNQQKANRWDFCILLNRI